MSLKPLDLLRSPVRAVVCPPCLIVCKDLYWTRVRERNKNEKASTGYPSDEYRGNVTLPAYLESRPATPQSLGYGSTISEPTMSGHTTRGNSDTTNSPTKTFFTQPSASASDHTRKVVVEQIPSRKKNQQSSADNTKENQSMIYHLQSNHLRWSWSTSSSVARSSRLDVFTRLGPMMTPNMNAKRFKADTSHNSKR